MQIAEVVENLKPPVAACDASQREMIARYRNFSAKGGMGAYGEISRSTLLGFSEMSREPEAL